MRAREGAVLSVAASISLPYSVTVSPFTSERERRLWLWTLVVLAAIYASLGPSQAAAAWLRAHDLLRVALGAAVAGGALVFVWWWLKTRPGWPALGVGFGLSFVFLWALARVGVPPEERTHLIEYAVVAAFIYQALVERRRNGRAVPAPDALTVLGTTVLGWVDEAVQWLLPHRVYDVRDVFFNFLAGVMFVFAALCVALVRRRKKGTDPRGPAWPATLPKSALLPRLAVLAVPLGVAAYIGFGPQPAGEPASEQVGTASEPFPQLEPTVQGDLGGALDGRVRELADEGFSRSPSLRR